MKFTIKKERKIKRHWNLWIITAIVTFAIVTISSYLVLTSITSSQQTQQLITLNSECASYGAQLTQELAANSTACLLNKNFTASTNITTVCGATFYCAYSVSCANTKPVQTNTLNCLCDGLFPNRVAMNGFCFKQALS